MQYVEHSPVFMCDWEGCGRRSKPTSAYLGGDYCPQHASEIERRKAEWVKACWILAARIFVAVMFLALAGIVILGGR